MHDHMDVGGRTMPGAIVEEVEQRREQLSRMGVIVYWMLAATD
jgi:hypothetical protein